MYRRALAHWSTQDSPPTQVALERAITLDPRFAPAHALLADVHSSAADRGTRPYAEALEKAEGGARTAIALDPHMPDAWAMLSRIHLMRGERDAALHSANEAVRLGPNHVGAHMARGHVLVFMGRHAEARLSLATALRLNPMDPAIRTAEMLTGVSLFLNREYGAAVAQLRALTLKYPGYSAANRWLMLAQAQAGKLEEARVTLARVMELAPNVLPRIVAGRPLGMTQGDYDHVLSALRAVGYGQGVGVV